VRNTWYARFSKAGSADHHAVFDETKDDRPDEQLDPEALVIQRQAVERVQRAIEGLPVDFREVIVLRELEGLSYKEIAAIVGVPIGTVMSQLARGRERLLGLLDLKATIGGAGELSYQRRQHIINLFVWPASDTGAAPTDTRAVRGFHVRHWTRNGMAFWAVSDLNELELDQFVGALGP
jgi:anti-sigma factor RsiW